MYEVVESLKTTQILGYENIISLKNYICEQFHGACAKKRAILLAKSIHRKLDKYIQEFDEQHRMKIRFKLLQNVVKNNYPEVYASDIFQTCLILNLDQDLNEDYIKSFTSWINNNQKIRVSKEELIEFIETIKQKNISPLECNLKLALDNLISNEVSIPTNSLTNDTQNIDYKKLFLENLNLVWQKIIYKKAPKILVYFIVLFAMLVIPLSQAISWPVTNPVAAPVLNPVINPKPTEPVKAVMTKPQNIEPERKSNALPEYLQYKAVDEISIKNYLRQKNSMLAEEPYFSTIIKVSDDFNINPLLIFAIAGQEQGFVPKSNKNSAKIANNPFNVYHSWQDYNTNIYDSTKIAARTILRLSKDRPETINALQWINRKYAQDKDWWKGVEYFYQEMDKQKELGVHGQQKTVQRN